MKLSIGSVYAFICDFSEMQCGVNCLDLSSHVSHRAKSILIVLKDL